MSFFLTLAYFRFILYDILVLICKLWIVCDLFLFQNWTLIQVQLCLQLALGALFLTHLENQVQVETVLINLCSGIITWFTFALVLIMELHYLLQGFGVYLLFLHPLKVHVLHLWWKEKKQAVHHYKYYNVGKLH